jgi:hypothetical protein
LKVLKFKKVLEPPKKRFKALSLPEKLTGLCPIFPVPFPAANVACLETQHLLAIQKEFIPLEDSPMSLSRLEAELHARMAVAQSNLELDISSYNKLKSKYYSVINRSADLAK